MARGQRGHTLIEVMIAAFVFTVGALGLLRLLIASSEGTSVSEKVTYATILAREKLDELMRMPYDTIASGEEATNLNERGEAKGDFGSAQDSDGWFARSWAVGKPDEDHEYKQIQVDVKWADRSMKLERRVSVVGGKSER